MRNLEHHLAALIHSFVIFITDLKERKQDTPV